MTLCTPCAWPRAAVACDSAWERWRYGRWSSSGDQANRATARLLLDRFDQHGPDRNAGTVWLQPVLALCLFPFKNTQNKKAERGRQGER